MMNAIQETLHRLGQRYAIQEALLLHRSVGAVIWPWIESFDRKWGFDSAFQPAQKVTAKGTNGEVAPIALIDTYGLGLIRIILGLRERLERLTENEIHYFLQKVRWEHQESLYHHAFPRQVWHDLEILQKNIEFEVSIEGQPISPEWLQKQVIARGFAKFLNETLPEILKEVENELASRATAMLKEKRYFEAVAVAERGYEACNKLEFHLNSFRECNDRLLALRHLPDEFWPEIEWSALGERVQKAQGQLGQVFASLIVPFMDKPRPAALPDYFGRSVSFLVNEAHEALVHGNEDNFKRYFPLLFIGSLASRDRVIQDYKNVPNPNYVFAHSTEPIMNILALSGLALIYSELDNKPFWQVVEDCWNTHLTKFQNSEQLCQLISLATKDRVWMPKGAWNLLRTNWKLTLERKLRETGFLGRRRNVITGKLPSPPNHSSQFIDRLTRHGFDNLFVDAEDIFIAHYLAHRPEAASLKVGSQCRTSYKRME